VGQQRPYRGSYQRASWCHSRRARSLPADALPGLTRLRLGHAAALVELSPVAVPDSGFGAGDISNAGSKVLAVSLASAAGMGYPSRLST
jgi:hypothetical protein